MTTQAIIGIHGDTVPAGAIVDGKIAYAYVAFFGNKKKCAGYATPKALEILKADGKQVSIELFEVGADIPNLMDGE